MFKRIITELGHHAPFTVLGAISGIGVMVIIVVTDVPQEASHDVFHILHPLHVIFSALTTTAMYQKYGGGKLWVAVLIGYSGSIGIASLSDAIIPFLGGALLGIDIEFHIPFIETQNMYIIEIPTWIVINSAAIFGIIIGYLKPTTKFPHLGHVFLSTGASLFYFTTYGVANWLPLLFFIFVFLFLAVWLPCCISDIVFPLLFTRGKLLHEHI
ncbi:hypothetical protein ACFLVU_03095 [Chloroflexota bacterium]